MAKRRRKGKTTRSGPERSGAGLQQGTVSQSVPDRSRGRPQAAKTGAAGKTPPQLLVAAAALAALGVLLTAYLTLVKWFGQSPAYCEAGSGCDLVQASRWSVLLGMPLAFWGFLMYVLLLALLWRQLRKRSVWKYALTVAAFGTGMSIYLTAISVFEIEATCIYCLLSLAIISAIFLVLLFIRPPHQQRFDWGTWSLGTAGGIVIFLAMLHMHYSGIFDPAAGPEEPYLQALAEHLGAGDAKFFGAYWCPHCQEQKALFEASADRLPYVECTPGGRGGPMATDCVTNGIESYPTWIIAGRKYEGVLSLERLARLSGFRASETAVKP